MTKIGRNDPCPCGSGKKYKQCHGPLDVAAAQAQRLTRQAPDTLLPTLLSAVQRFSDALPEALKLFWNGRYRVQTVGELDDHEDRGSERFLTWFLFDHVIEGQTPFQLLDADRESLDLNEHEGALMDLWTDVRFKPYVIETVVKGEGFTVWPLFGGDQLRVEDRAAAKRVAAGDVLIVHLLPVTLDTHFITGAAAHLSSDTARPLRDFAEVHLTDLQRTHPEATFDDLVRQRSYIFNHFVMALPRDEQGLSKLDELVVTAKATMNVMTDSLGITSQQPEAPVLVVPQGDAAEDEEAAEVTV